MSSETIGRYHIDRELGRGSMGRVLLAHDPEIDRRVAIKTIHIFNSLPDHERHEARERFLREVRAAGKLLHPGIVTLFDVGEDEGIPFLAMEYVEGQPLDRFCRPDTMLERATVIELVSGIAEALHYAHEQGIVHRDIKPANLIRVDETRAKIADFGLATGPQSNLTQDGALLGTPSYMSPEQIRGEEIGPASDLFSLAVVAYELLTAVKPFGGETVSSVLYRIVNEAPRDASALPLPVPPSLASFLERALAKDPAARFANGAEFARALREAGGALGLDLLSEPANTAPVETATIPPRPVRRRRRSGTPYVVGAALLFTAVATVAYFYREQWIDYLPAGAGGPAPILEASVRTDPPGLPITLDDQPLIAGPLTFSAQPPFSLLAVRQGCRTVEHRLQAADAGTEIVLVADPLELEVVVDPGVEGASVTLNGAPPLPVPAALALDLCAENEIVVEAAGYYEHRTPLSSGATPLQVRSALAEIALAPIPRGTLLLQAVSTPVKFYVDGEAVERSDEGLSLPAGSHRVRAHSSRYWVDITATVEIPAGETATTELRIPQLAELAVQAFPSNCRVSLRRPRQRKWVFLDTTPMRRRIAEGTYEVQVQFVPTGAVQERTIEVRRGAEPERFSFAGSGS